jgi:hypothetical protein
VTEDWLDKCDKLEHLDFDVDYKVIEGLNGALKKGCPSLIVTRLAVSLL